MFEFLKFGKWRKWAEEKFSSIETELHRFATKGEVEEIARELAELNTALDRLEKHVKKVAMEEIRKEVNVEIELIRAERRKIEELVKELEELKECCERVRLLEEDYNRFRSSTSGELSRIKAKILSLSITVDKCCKSSPKKKRIRRTVRTSAHVHATLEPN